MEQQELLFTGEYVNWHNQLTKILSLLSKIEVVYIYPAQERRKIEVAQTEIINELGDITPNISYTCKRT